MNHSRRAAVPTGESIGDGSLRTALKVSPKKTIVNVQLIRKLKAIRTPMKRLLSSTWLSLALALIAGALLPACLYKNDVPTVTVVGATTSSITLQWAAPGVSRGTLATGFNDWVSPIDSYDLRYSTTPI